METEQGSGAVRTRMSGPRQSPEEFCKKGLPHQFNFSKHMLTAETSSAQKHRSCSTRRLFAGGSFSRWVRMVFRNLKTKKKLGFESIFEDPNRKVSPSPLPIACCLSLFLYLTGHFPVVPSPVMGFPVAMCFDTGFSIVSHRGYCFLSWQSDCHVVCQVLKYIIFSKAAALHSVTL